MGRYWTLRATRDTNNNDYKHVLCKGKFWVAVQSSDDFEKLGFVKSDIQELYWKGCNCSFQSDDDIDYCANCYDCQEDHEKAAEEDGEDTERLYFESNMVRYEGDKSKAYHVACGMIKGFESAKLHTWFDEYNVFSEEGKDEIVVDAVGTWETKVEELSDGQLELMARYDLCRIVKYIFELGVDDMYVECEF